MNAARNTQQDMLYAALCMRSCKPYVADIIARGTTFAETAFAFKQRFCYVAGPMRGYDKFNFPAFDAARDALVAEGWSVISPADIDRASGFTEDSEEGTVDVKDFIYRDFHAIHYLMPDRGDAVFFLPGWERSTGAFAEFGLARWHGLLIFNAPFNAYRLVPAALMNSLAMDRYALGHAVSLYLDNQGRSEHE